MQKEKTHRDYGHNDRTSQDQHSKNYTPQQNRDSNESRNAIDESNTDSQRSPENGRDSNVPGSNSGSYTTNTSDADIDSNFDGDIEDEENLIPNPDEYDEGDSDGTYDTERDATRTPGL